MKTSLPILLFIALISIASANEKLMRDFGTYSFKGDGFEVTIELKRIANDALAPTITFQDDKTKGSMGIGEGESLAVVPGRWAAQFRPPNELWIYDGTDLLQLYERTIDPKGFKATSSRVVPPLRDRAPEDLKKLMLQQG